MPLYQKSVLNKYLKLQNAEAIAKAYKKFSKNFLDPKRQERIRGLKEEQYQGEFLDDLFVQVFGYSKPPSSNPNLIPEYKNVQNSKKADGAIMKNGEALAVIELKSMKTKDLGLIEEQAFGYKNNQPGCKYVITSNFEKIRFYINDTIDPEEFDLFNLSEERFALLYLCIASENLLENLPLKVKEASLAEEESITKKFYADYSQFKRELFRDLVKKNIRNDVFRNVLAAEETEKADKNIKMNLFKKSQKLIDRFLFVFFAEDRGLLPPNSTEKILADWNKLKDLDAPVPLYNRFKLYFHLLFEGRPGTNDKAEIYAYNGGLFKPDAILDSLLIDDELLYKHTRTLAHYDFDSQVDVNILGHIFENSLNEIESVNAEIEGTDFDKQKTKRKKDGVFYTPKYITKYIVDNTVGKLCDEKKHELDLDTVDFSKNYRLKTARIIEVEEEVETGSGILINKSKKKTNLSVEGEEIVNNLEKYRKYLLSLTICDPACGSGAFLNQALDYLIHEHGVLDEMMSNVQGSAFVFQEIENTILEKNIYGVDLNEESVEIAKLSLWLRTAQKGRKLNSLNNNIKCGNSLIESKAVAGDKAFKWEDEFPEVFARGGFDVIIGNPPYVSTKEINENDKIFFKGNFDTAIGQFDLYGLFMERSYNLLKENGCFSFITSNTFIANKDFLELRKFLLTKTQIYEIVNLGETVFEDANLDVAILSFIKRSAIMVNKIKVIKNRRDFDENTASYITQKFFFDDVNNYEYKINCKQKDLELINRLFNENDKLGEILDLPRGIEVGGNSELVTKVKNEYPIIFGRSISQYEINFGGDYIAFDHTDNSKFKKAEIYTQPKILIQRIRNLSLRQRIVAAYDDTSLYCTNTLRIGVPKEGVDVNLIGLLGILNSKLINYIFLKFFLNKDIYAYQLQLIPIPAAELDSIAMNSSTLKVKKELFSEKKNSFLRYLGFEGQNIKVSKKLQSFYELNFQEFIKELNKSLKKINGNLLEDGKSQFSIMKLFEEQRKEALELKAEIDKTDKEIDQMVYELYGLSEEEIKIVEGS